MPDASPSTPEQESQEIAPAEVTQMLINWSRGDRAALNKLLPIVYAELRRLAHSYLQRERPDHTLQATALVHEAYLRLVGAQNIEWQNRAHFFGVAANLMRQILVERARAHRAIKRGGGAAKLSLDDVPSLTNERDDSLLLLDEALSRLARIDPQASRLVELRYFAGLTIEETAEVMNTSPMTIKREWATARAWLHREIGSS